MTYALVLVFIFCASAWLELVLRASVFRRWRRLLATLLIVTPVFLLWDVAAVSWGHWWFDESQVSAWRVPGGLPVEEVLFFPIVGLAVILTFEAVRAMRKHPDAAASS
jgi:lycopene cyclase domain-containing protein